MTSRTYWLDLFTAKTWEEFIDSGGKVSGFREHRWKLVQQVKIGDYLLCYLTGVSRWIGILEVTSTAFKDGSPIWKDDNFPCRLKVKNLAKLTIDTAVPVLDLRDRLSIFSNLKSPMAWTGHFRGSPSRFSASDGLAISQAILEAQKNPIHRPSGDKKGPNAPSVLAISAAFA